jgi:hypothetical protein
MRLGAMDRSFESVKLVPSESNTHCVGTSPIGSAAVDSGPQSVDEFEIAAEHGFARPAEPAFEQRCVNLAEISVKFDVAIFEDIEAGMFPNQTGPYLRSGQKHWGGGAVVGALAGVFCDASTKFAKRHHQRSIAMAVVCDIVEEGSDRAAELLQ